MSSPLGGLPDAPVTQVNDPYEFEAPWGSWLSIAQQILQDVSNSGPTSARPTSFLYKGKPYFDTTLGKPIWYGGAGWVDATGAGV